MSKQDIIVNYYKKQSVFYDFTRPLFLFGRNEIIKLISNKKPKGKLLEIGCGTGYLLHKLSDKTELELTGIDLSAEMLTMAKKKLGNDIVLFHSDLMDYDSAIKYDYIILSYVFTLDLANALVHIDKVKSLLKPNGRIYVVDFQCFFIDFSIVFWQLPKISIFIKML